MEKQKSILTQQVREAINKAAQKGEDVIKTVEKITEEAFIEAIKNTNKTIDEVEEIVWDIFEGAFRAGKDIKINFNEFMDNAIQVIKNGLLNTKIVNNKKMQGKLDHLTNLLKEGKEKSLQVFYDLFYKMRETDWKNLFKKKRTEK